MCISHPILEMNSTIFSWSGSCAVLEWLIHQGQRRSPRKVVGGAKSHLESKPITARDAQRTQTNLVWSEITFRIKAHNHQRRSEDSNKPCVHQDPETPPEIETELCLSVSCGGTGKSCNLGQIIWPFVALVSSHIKWDDDAYCTVLLWEGQCLEQRRHTKTKLKIRYSWALFLAMDWDLKWNLTLCPYHSDYFPFNTILFPSPPHISGLSQSTGFECPASCIEFALVIYFTYGNICVSVLFS